MFILICQQIIHKHKTIYINVSCLSVFGEFMQLEPHCSRNLIMMMIYCEIDILYSLRAEHFFFSLPNLGISPFLIVNKRVGCGGEYDRHDKEGLEQTYNIILCGK